MTCADVFSEDTSAALQVSALKQKKTSGASVEALE
jgi:hypothetical protein